MASSSRVRAGQAFVEIYADSSRLKKGLSVAEADISAFSRNAISSLAALSLPVMGLTKLFASFDDTMRTVAATTGNAMEPAIGGVKSLNAAVVRTNITVKESVENMKMLERTAREIGRTTSFTAKQAAEAMVILARAGKSVTEINAMTKHVLNLSRATGTAVPEAANIAIGALNSFNLAANRTRQTVDLLVSTANASPQTLANIGAALKYIGPVADSVNLSLRETLQDLSLLAKFNIKGEQAGSSLRNMYMRMASAKNQAKYLKAFGISLVDAEGNLRNINEVLRETKQYIDRTGVSMAKTADVMKEVFSMRSLPAAFAMLNNAAQASIKLSDTVSRAKIAASQMEEGIGGGVRALVSRLQELGIAFMKAFEKPIRQFLNDATKISDIFIRFVNGAKHLADAVAPITRTFGWIFSKVALFGGLVIAFTGMAKGLKLVNSYASQTLGVYTAIYNKIKQVASGKLAVPKISSDQIKLDGINKAREATRYLAENMTAASRSVSRAIERFNKLHDTFIRISGSSAKIKENIRALVRPITDLNLQARLVGTAFSSFQKNVQSSRKEVQTSNRAFLTLLERTTRIATNLTNIGNRLNVLSKTFASNSGTIAKFAATFGSFQNSAASTGRNLQTIQKSVKRFVSELRTGGRQIRSFEERFLRLSKSMAKIDTSLTKVLKTLRDFVAYLSDANKPLQTANAYVGKLRQRFGDLSSSASNIRRVMTAVTSTVTKQNKELLKNISLFEKLASAHKTMLMTYAQLAPKIVAVDKPKTSQPRTSSGVRNTEPWDPVKAKIPKAPFTYNEITRYAQLAREFYSLVGSLANAQKRYALNVRSFVMFIRSIATSVPAANSAVKTLTSTLNLFNETIAKFNSKTAPVTSGITGITLAVKDSSINMKALKTELNSIYQGAMKFERSALKGDGIRGFSRRLTDLKESTKYIVNNEKTIVGALNRIAFAFRNVAANSATFAGSFLAFKGAVPLTKVFGKIDTGTAKREQVQKRKTVERTPVSEDLGTRREAFLERYKQPKPKPVETEAERNARISAERQKKEDAIKERRNQVIEVRNAEVNIARTNLRNLLSDAKQDTQTKKLRFEESFKQNLRAKTEVGKASSADASMRGRIERLTKSSTDDLLQKRRSLEEILSGALIDFREETNDAVRSYLRNYLFGLRDSIKAEMDSVRDSIFQRNFRKEEIREELRDIRENIEAEQSGIRGSQSRIRERKQTIKEIEQRDQARAQIEEYSKKKQEYDANREKLPQALEELDAEIARLREQLEQERKKSQEVQKVRAEIASLRKEKGMSLGDLEREKSKVQSEKAKQEAHRDTTKEEYIAAGEKFAQSDEIKEREELVKGNKETIERARSEEQAKRAKLEEERTKEIEKQEREVIAARELKRLESRKAKLRTYEDIFRGGDNYIQEYKDAEEAPGKLEDALEEEYTDTLGGFSPKRDKYIEWLTVRASESKEEAERISRALRKYKHGELIDRGFSTKLSTLGAEIEEKEIELERVRKSIESDLADITTAFRTHTEAEAAIPELRSELERLERIRDVRKRLAEKVGIGSFGQKDSVTGANKEHHERWVAEQELVKYKPIQNLTTEEKTSQFNKVYQKLYETIRDQVLSGKGKTRNLLQQTLGNIEVPEKVSVREGLEFRDSYLARLREQSEFAPFNQGDIESIVKDFRARIDADRIAAITAQREAEEKARKAAEKARKVAESTGSVAGGQITEQTNSANANIPTERPDETSTGGSSSEAKNKDFEELNNRATDVSIDYYNKLSEKANALLREYLSLLSEHFDKLAEPLEKFLDTIESPNGISNDDVIKYQQKLDEVLVNKVEGFVVRPKQKANLSKEDKQSIVENNIKEANEELAYYRESGTKVPEALAIKTFDRANDMAYRLGQDYLFQFLDGVGFEHGKGSNDKTLNKFADQLRAISDIAETAKEVVATPKASASAESIAPPVSSQSEITEAEPAEKTKKQEQEEKKEAKRQRFLQQSIERANAILDSTKYTDKQGKEQVYYGLSDEDVKVLNDIIDKVGDIKGYGKKEFVEKLHFGLFPKDVEETHWQDYQSSEEHARYLRDDIIGYRRKLYDENLHKTKAQSSEYQNALQEVDEDKVDRDYIIEAVRSVTHPDNKKRDSLNRSEVNEIVASMEEFGEETSASQMKAVVEELSGKTLEQLNKEINPNSKQKVFNRNSISKLLQHYLSSFKIIEDVDQGQEAKPASEIIPSQNTPPSKGTTPAPESAPAQITSPTNAQDLLNKINGIIAPNGVKPDSLQEADYNNVLSLLQEYGKQNAASDLRSVVETILGQKLLRANGTPALLNKTQLVNKVRDKLQSEYKIAGTEASKEVEKAVRQPSSSSGSDKSKDNVPKNLSADASTLRDEINGILAADEVYESDLEDIRKKIKTFRNTKINGKKRPVSEVRDLLKEFGYEDAPRKEGEPNPSVNESVDGFFEILRKKRTIKEGSREGTESSTEEKTISVSGIQNLQPEEGIAETPTIEAEQKEETPKVPAKSAESKTPAAATEQKSELSNAGLLSVNKIRQLIASMEGQSIEERTNKAKKIDKELEKYWKKGESEGELYNIARELGVKLNPSDLRLNAGNELALVLGELLTQNGHVDLAYGDNYLKDFPETKEFEKYKVSPVSYERTAAVDSDVEKDYLQKGKEILRSGKIAEDEKASLKQAISSAKKNYEEFGFILERIVDDLSEKIKRITDKANEIRTIASRETTVSASTLTSTAQSALQKAAESTAKSSKSKSDYFEELQEKRQRERAKQQAIKSALKPPEPTEQPKPKPIPKRPFEIKVPTLQDALLDYWIMREEAEKKARENFEKKVAGNEGEVVKTVSEQMSFPALTERGYKAKQYDKIPTGRNEEKARVLQSLTDRARQITGRGTASGKYPNSLEEAQIKEIMEVAEEVSQKLNKEHLIEFTKTLGVQGASGTKNDILNKLFQHLLQGEIERLFFDIEEVTSFDKTKFSKPEDIPSITEEQKKLQMSKVSDFAKKYGVVGLVNYIESSQKNPEYGSGSVLDLFASVQKNLEKDRLNREEIRKGNKPLDVVQEELAKDSSSSSAIVLESAIKEATGYASVLKKNPSEALGKFTQDQLNRIVQLGEEVYQSSGLEDFYKYIDSLGIIGDHNSKATTNEGKKNELLERLKGGIGNLLGMIQALHGTRSVQDTEAEDVGIAIEEETKSVREQKPVAVPKAIASGSLDSMIQEAIRLRDKVTTELTEDTTNAILQIAEQVYSDYDIKGLQKFAKSLESIYDYKTKDELIASIDSALAEVTIIRSKSSAKLEDNPYLGLLDRKTMGASIGEDRSESSVKPTSLEQKPVERTIENIINDALEIVNALKHKGRTYYKTANSEEDETKLIQLAEESYSSFGLKGLYKYIDELGLTGGHETYSKTEIGKKYELIERLRSSYGNHYLSLDKMYRDLSSKTINEAEGFAGTEISQSKINAEPSSLLEELDNIVIGKKQKQETTKQAEQTTLPADASETIKEINAILSKDQVTESDLEDIRKKAKVFRNKKIDGSKRPITDLRALLKALGYEDPPRSEGQPNPGANESIEGYLEMIRKNRTIAKEPKESKPAKTSKQVASSSTSKKSSSTFKKPKVESAPKTSEISVEGQALVNELEALKKETSLKESEIEKTFDKLRKFRKDNNIAKFRDILKAVGYEAQSGEKVETSLSGFKSILGQGRTITSDVEKKPSGRKRSTFSAAQKEQYLKDSIERAKTILLGSQVTDSKGKQTSYYGLSDLEFDVLNGMTERISSSEYGGKKYIEQFFESLFPKEYASRMKEYYDGRLSKPNGSEFVERLNEIFKSRHGRYNEQYQKIKEDSLQNLVDSVISADEQHKEMALVPKAEEKPVVPVVKPASKPVAPPQEAEKENKDEDKEEKKKEKKPPKPFSAAIQKKVAEAKKYLEPRDSSGNPILVEDAAINKVVNLVKQTAEKEGIGEGREFARGLGVSAQTNDLSTLLTLLENQLKTKKFNWNKPIKLAQLGSAYDEENNRKTVIEAALKAASSELSDQLLDSDSSSASTQVIVAQINDLKEKLQRSKDALKQIDDARKLLGKRNYSLNTNVSEPANAESQDLNLKPLTGNEGSSAVKKIVGIISGSENPKRYSGLLGQIRFGTDTEIAGGKQISQSNIVDYANRLGTVIANLKKNHPEDKETTEQIEAVLKTFLDQAFLVGESKNTDPKVREGITDFGKSLHDDMVPLFYGALPGNKKPIEELDEYAKLFRRIMTSTDQEGRQNAINELTEKYVEYKLNKEGITKENLEKAKKIYPSIKKLDEATKKKIRARKDKDRDAFDKAKEEIENTKLELTAIMKDSNITEKEKLEAPGIVELGNKIRKQAEQRVGYATTVPEIGIRYQTDNPSVVDGRNKLFEWIDTIDEDSFDRLVTRKHGQGEDKTYDLSFDKPIADTEGDTTKLSDLTPDPSALTPLEAMIQQEEVAQKEKDLEAIKDSKTLLSPLRQAIADAIVITDKKSGARRTNGRISDRELARVLTEKIKKARDTYLTSSGTPEEIKDAEELLKDALLSMGNFTDEERKGLYHNGKVIIDTNFFELLENKFLKLSQTTRTNKVTGVRNQVLEHFGIKIEDLGESTSKQRQQEKETNKKESIRDLLIELDELGLELQDLDFDVIDIDKADSEVDAIASRLGDATQTVLNVKSPSSGEVRSPAARRVRENLAKEERLTEELASLRAQERLAGAFRNSINSVYYNRDVDEETAKERASEFNNPEFFRKYRRIAEQTISESPTKMREIDSYFTGQINESHEAEREIVRKLTEEIETAEAEIERLSEEFEKNSPEAKEYHQTQKVIERLNAVVRKYNDLIARYNSMREEGGYYDQNIEKLEKKVRGYNDKEHKNRISEIERRLNDLMLERDAIVKNIATEFQDSTEGKGLRRQVEVLSRKAENADRNLRELMMSGAPEAAIEEAEREANIAKARADFSFDDNGNLVTGKSYAQNKESDKTERKEAEQEIATEEKYIEDTTANIRDEQVKYDKLRQQFKEVSDNSGFYNQFNELQEEQTRLDHVVSGKASVKDYASVLDQELYGTLEAYNDGLAKIESQITMRDSLAASTSELPRYADLSTTGFRRIAQIMESLKNLFSVDSEEQQQLSNKIVELEKAVAEIDNLRASINAIEKRKNSALDNFDQTAREKEQTKQDYEEAIAREQELANSPEVEQAQRELQRKEKVLRDVSKRRNPSLNGDIDSILSKIVNSPLPTTSNLAKQFNLDFLSEVPEQYRKQYESGLQLGFANFEKILKALNVDASVLGKVAFGELLENNNFGEFDDLTNQLQLGNAQTFEKEFGSKMDVGIASKLVHELTHALTNAVPEIREQMQSLLNDIVGGYAPLLDSNNQPMTDADGTSFEVGASPKVRVPRGGTPLLKPREYSDGTKSDTEILATAFERMVRGDADIENHREYYDLIDERLKTAMGLRNASSSGNKAGATVRDLFESNGWKYNEERGTMEIDLGSSDDEYAEFEEYEISKEDLAKSADSFEDRDYVEKYGSKAKQPEFKKDEGLTIVDSSVTPPESPKPEEITWDDVKDMPFWDRGKLENFLRESGVPEDVIADYSERKFGKAEASASVSTKSKSASVIQPESPKPVFSYDDVYDLPEGIQGEGLKSFLLAHGLSESAAQNYVDRRYMEDVLRRYRNDSKIAPETRDSLAEPYLLGRTEELFGDPSLGLAPSSNRLQEPNIRKKYELILRRYGNLSQSQREEYLDRVFNSPSISQAPSIPVNGGSSVIPPSNGAGLSVSPTQPVPAASGSSGNKPPLPPAPPALPSPEEPEDNRGGYGFSKKGLFNQALIEREREDAEDNLRSLMLSGAPEPMIREAEARVEEARHKESVANDVFGRVGQVGSISENIRRFKSAGPEIGKKKVAWQSLVAERDRKVEEIEKNGNYDDETKKTLIKGINQEYEPKIKQADKEYAEAAQAQDDIAKDYVSEIKELKKPLVEAWDNAKATLAEEERKIGEELTKIDTSVPGYTERIAKERERLTGPGTEYEKAKREENLRAMAVRTFEETNPQAVTVKQLQEAQRNVQEAKFKKEQNDVIRNELIGQTTTSINERQDAISKQLTQKGALERQKNEVEKEIGKQTIAQSEAINQGDKEAEKTAKANIESLTESLGQLGESITNLNEQIKKEQEKLAEEQAAKKQIEETAQEDEAEVQQAEEVFADLKEKFDFLKIGGQQQGAGGGVGAYAKSRWESFKRGDNLNDDAKRLVKTLKPVVTIFRSMAAVSKNLPKSFKNLWTSMKTGSKTLMTLVGLRRAEASAEIMETRAKIKAYTATVAKIGVNIAEATAVGLVNMAAGPILNIIGQIASMLGSMILMQGVTWIFDKITSFFGWIGDSLTYMFDWLFGLDTTKTDKKRQQKWDEKSEEKRTAADEGIEKANNVSENLDRLESLSKQDYVTGANRQEILQIQNELRKSGLFNSKDIRNLVRYEENEDGTKRAVINKDLEKNLRSQNGRTVRPLTEDAADALSKGIIGTLDIMKFSPTDNNVAYATRNLNAMQDYLNEQLTNGIGFSTSGKEKLLKDIEKFQHEVNEIVDQDVKDNMQEMVDQLRNTVLNGKPHKKLNIDAMNDRIDEILNDSQTGLFNWIEQVGLDNDVSKKYRTDAQKMMAGYNEYVDEIDSDLTQLKEQLKTVNVDEAREIEAQIDHITSMFKLVGEKVTEAIEKTLVSLEKEFGTEGSIKAINLFEELENKLKALNEYSDLQKTQVYIDNKEKVDEMTKEKNEAIDKENKEKFEEYEKEEDQKLEDRKTEIIKKYYGQDISEEEIERIKAEGLTGEGLQEATDVVYKKIQKARGKFKEDYFWGNKENRNRIKEEAQARADAFRALHPDFDFNQSFEGASEETQKMLEQGSANLQLKALLEEEFYNQVVSKDPELKKLWDKTQMSESDKERYRKEMDAANAENEQHKKEKKEELDQAAAEEKEKTRNEAMAEVSKGAIEGIDKEKQAERERIEAEIEKQRQGIIDQYESQIYTGGQIQARMNGETQIDNLENAAKNLADFRKSENRRRIAIAKEELKNGAFGEEGSDSYKARLAEIEKMEAALVGQDAEINKTLDAQLIQIRGKAGLYKEISQAEFDQKNIYGTVGFQAIKDMTYNPLDYQKAVAENKLNFQNLVETQQKVIDDLNSKGEDATKELERMENIKLAQTLADFALKVNDQMEKAKAEFESEKLEDMFRNEGVQSDVNKSNEEYQNKKNAFTETYKKHQLKQIEELQKLGYTDIKQNEAGEWVGTKDGKEEVLSGMNEDEETFKRGIENMERRQAQAAQMAGAFQEGEKAKLKQRIDSQERLAQYLANQGISRDMLVRDENGNITGVNGSEEDKKKFEDIKSYNDILSKSEIGQNKIKYNRGKVKAAEFKISTKGAGFDSPMAGREAILMEVIKKRDQLDSEMFSAMEAIANDDSKTQEQKDSLIRKMNVDLKNARKQIDMKSKFDQKMFGKTLDLGIDSLDSKIAQLRIDERKYIENAIASLEIDPDQIVYGKNGEILRVRGNREANNIIDEINANRRMKETNLAYDKEKESADFQKEVRSMSRGGYGQQMMAADLAIAQIEAQQGLSGNDEYTNRQLDNQMKMVQFERARLNYFDKMDELNVLQNQLANAEANWNEAQSSNASESEKKEAWERYQTALRGVGDSQKDALSAFKDLAGARAEAQNIQDERRETYNSGTFSAYEASSGQNLALAYSKKQVEKLTEIAMNVAAMNQDTI